MRRQILPFLAGALLTGCGSPPAPPEPNPLGQPGTFAIKEVSSIPTAGGTNKVWAATLTCSNGSAFHFWFEITVKKDGGTDPLDFSRAALTRQIGNDGRQALKEIAKAIEAKTIPTQSERVDRLEFPVLILGTGMSRSETREPGTNQTAESFSQNPPGNWTTTKALFNNRKAEVFLNFNPKLGVAEFAPRDSNSGSDVMAELAKVFLP
ncbi:MAG TPA: hypothetical protein VEI07_12120 [Planctomycetaceae bacterium]|nr:hypothetical protein [Planctomycetaceae bacterium]